MQCFKALIPFKATRATKAQMVLMVRTAKTVLKALWDCRELRVSRAYKAQTVLMVETAKTELKVLWDCRDLLASRVLLVCRAQQANKEQLACRDFKASEASKVLLVLAAI